jgi:hypothetical protein
MAKRTQAEKEIIALLKKDHVCKLDEIIWGVTLPHPPEDHVPEVIHALSALMKSGVIIGCSPDYFDEPTDYAWMLAE